MRKAPRVASSWLSWMSTLMTWTGWWLSSSLEFRSEDKQGQGQTLRHPPGMWVRMGREAAVSPSRTWSYTLSSQVMTRSNLSLQFWKRSGLDLIRLLRSSMCRMPFCVYLKGFGQGRHRPEAFKIKAHPKRTCYYKIRVQPQDIRGGEKAGRCLGPSRPWQRAAAPSSGSYWYCQSITKKPRNCSIHRTIS